MAAGEIKRIAADRPAEVLEVDADLIGAPGLGTGFEKGGAVFDPTQDFKFRHSRQSIEFNNSAGAELTRIRANGSLTNEEILRRMTMHPDQIVFLYLPTLELWL